MNNENIEKRIEQLEKKMDAIILEQKEIRKKRVLIKHNEVEEYYTEFIRDCSKEEAWKAVEDILRHPIEMTVEDIEKAFGHKIKIVDGAIINEGRGI